MHFSLVSMEPLSQTQFLRLDAFVQHENKKNLWLSHSRAALKL